MKPWLTLALLAVVPTLAGADGVGSATRVFEGSGRACHGKLVVTPKSIAWDTPFSRCAASAYEVLEQSGKGNEQRAGYLLKKRGKGCLYQVIVLEHNAASRADLDWSAKGFQSVDDYKARNEQNALMCGLVQVK
jgi:hypothetical protein